jgi:hypothetical protein
MWTQPQEEHRERKLLEDPISFHDTPLLHVEHLLDSEPLAEAGLKVCQFLWEMVFKYEP